VEVLVHTVLNPPVIRDKGISSRFWPLYSPRWHSTPLRRDRIFVGPQGFSGHWQKWKAWVIPKVRLWFTIYRHLLQSLP